VGKRKLVALDYNHIKNYVFATDKLKEIRGASAILDRLNRQDMRDIAKDVDPNAKLIFANGGAGLFEVDTDKADKFGERVQQALRKQTAGNATITYAVQELPDGKEEIKDELAMMRYQLREEKNCPAGTIVLPSHPFMRSCSSCGTEYAEDQDKTGAQDPNEQDALFCANCLNKRSEDARVKKFIKQKHHKGGQPSNQSKNAESPLWQRVISILLDADYRIPEGTDRPNDFNDFRNFGKAKDYIGLIYADGNSMGSKIEKLPTLPEIRDFAKAVDDSIYEVVCDAIKEHLPVWEGVNQESGKRESLFPFDLLLLGGDDVVMVTSAAVAMEVARTIATSFHKYTKEKDADKKGHTLSIGVVLAPVKYPFGLLQDLAEGALKHAKMEGAKRKLDKERGKKTIASDYGETLINFMTVTGSTSHDFKKVYKSLYDRDGKVSGHEGKVAFYATLRPYTIEELDFLLKMIREGKKLGLGRTKLHQAREAVLQMNLTTSVYEGMALLRNWRSRQRDFVTQYVRETGWHYQKPHSDEEKPSTMFPRAIFPWFADGPDTYKTPLLDFVELYDFVAQEDEDAGAN
jgi:hypothetical protein